MENTGMVIWNILQSFCIFYSHLVMLWLFGIFSPIMVNCVKKNLATLALEAGLAAEFIGKLKINRSH
jgi:hypothetical protein